MWTAVLESPVNKTYGIKHVALDKWLRSCIDTRVHARDLASRLNLLPIPTESTQEEIETLWREHIITTCRQWYEATYK